MIEVSIYVSSVDKIANRCALRRRLNDSDFRIPYDDIISAAKALFGDLCIIVFEVSV